MVEPDFGATVIVVVSAFGMLFLAGVRMGHFLLVLLGALGALLVLVLSAPYRVKRLTAYTDPWADPYDTGFQLTQSLIAFGRGEWTGVGLGNSVQKLFYLPEAHTDFLFAVIAEEFGLLGAISVIFCFVLFIFNLINFKLMLFIKGMKLKTLKVMQLEDKKPFNTKGNSSVLSCLS